MAELGLTLKTVDPESLPSPRYPPALSTQDAPVHSLHSWPRAPATRALHLGEGRRGWGVIYGPSAVHWHTGPAWTWSQEDYKPVGLHTHTHPALQWHVFWDQQVLPNSGLPFTLLQFRIFIKPHQSCNDTELGHQDVTGAESAIASRPHQGSGSSRHGGHPSATLLGRASPGPLIPS